MPVDKLSRNKKGSTCKPCRQLKLKCDSADKYPGPCSRCTAAGKLRECIVDPGFRRVTNKQLVADLQSEIGRLRRELAQAKAATPTSGNDDNELVSTNVDLHSSTPQTDHTLTSQDSINGIESQMIDNVHLSPQSVHLLIAEYFRTFHPFFPILPEMPIFLASYNKNPFLLWTVLAIASSRQSTGLSSIYPLLVEPVRSLAIDLYDARSRSLETVQALLLLCMWPFPFQKAANDPSMMYSGIAVQVSYQIGLHRPGFADEFNYGDDASLVEEYIISRRKTWLGCFIASQASALKMGVPSTIAPGHTILSEITMSPNLDIPKALLTSCHILYHSHKTMSILGDDSTALDGKFPNPGPLVQSFEGDLHLIREQYAANWSDDLEVLYYDILLQVSSFELLKNQGETPFAKPDSSLVVKAAKAILAMINLFQNRIDQSKSWPMMIKYCIIFAICLAIKLACQKGKEDEVRLKLLDAVRRANRVVKSWIFYPKDIFGRSATRFDALLLQIDQEEESQAQHALFSDFIYLSDRKRYTDALKHGTKIRSRMGTSVVYEIMWTAKELMGSKEAHAVDSASGVHRSDTNSSLGQEPASTQSLMSSSLIDYSLIPEYHYPEGLDIWMDWQTMCDGCNIASVTKESTQ